MISIGAMLNQWIFYHTVISLPVLSCNASWSFLRSPMLRQGFFLGALACCSNVRDEPHLQTSVNFISDSNTVMFLQGWMKHVWLQTVSMKEMSTLKNLIPLENMQGRTINDHGGRDFIGKYLTNLFLLKNNIENWRFCSKNIINWASGQEYFSSVLPGSLPPLIIDGLALNSFS